MIKFSTTLKFATVLTVGLFVLGNSAFAEGKFLDDGADGAGLGCFAMAVFAPEYGACLEKPWNRDRWQETRTPRPTFDNPFVPGALNPPVIVAPNREGGGSTATGPNTGSFRSGPVVREVFGRIDMMRGGGGSKNRYLNRK